MNKKRKGQKEPKSLVYTDFPSKETQGKEDLMRLIRLSMKDGKLHKAYKNIQKTFLLMKADPRWPEGVSSMEFFEKALDLASPLILVRGVRVKGVVYKVPGPLSPSKSRGLGLRWILEGARRNSFNRSSFSSGLSRELLDLYHQGGYAFNKRLDLHKLAEENRPFSHFRWWHKRKGKKKKVKALSQPRKEKQESGSKDYSQRRSKPSIKRSKTS